MGWLTYVFAVRIHGRARFYLQRVDDRLSGEHPVLRRTSGAVAWYETEAEARDAAHALGEPLKEQSPEPVDLDAALAWTTNPQVGAVDYSLLMLTWHTLASLGVTAEPPVVIDLAETDGALGVVADKVHIGYDVTTNPKTTFEMPEWSAGELTMLADTLRDGLGNLIADAAWEA